MRFIFLLFFAFIQNTELSQAKNLQDVFQNGLNETDLRFFLQDKLEYNINASILPDDCLSVTKLNFGGNSTENLFRAQIEPICSLDQTQKKYIIKEVLPKNYNEINNLDRLMREHIFDLLPPSIHILLPLALYAINQDDKASRLDSNLKILRPKKSTQQTQSDMGDISENAQSNSDEPDYVEPIGNDAITLWRKSSSQIAPQQMQPNISQSEANPEDPAYVEPIGNSIPTPSSTSTQSTTPTYTSPRLFYTKTYFEIMEEAAGEEISNIFLRNNLDITHPEILETIKAYAKALAYIHQQFMVEKSIPQSITQIDSNAKDQFNLYKTLTHKDPHWGNVFYDLETQIISFIDNEGFADSINKRETIIRDLSRIAFFSISKYGNCMDKTYKANECANSIQISKQILVDYIQAYPENLQENLRAYVKKSLLELADTNFMQLHLDGLQHWKSELATL
jgi:hypothetical protein